MVAVNSTMLSLGTRAPEFKLPDAHGKLVSLDDFPQAQAYLVMFICNHCPFVIHIREQLAELTRNYQAQGVAIVGINSNDVERYPEDSPEQMAIETQRAGYSFPYLYDETQAVAKAYRAACTPDFFLFDSDKNLTYRGRFDATRPGSLAEPTGEDLTRAIDETLADRSISEDEQHPSIGCNIKWKPNHAPDYFLAASF